MVGRVSPLDLAIDAAVFAWVLYRQRRVRRVRLRFAGRVPVVLSLIGLFQFIHFTETHSPGAEVSMLAIGSCLVVAGATGALRAASVRLTPAERGAVIQQGTWLTVGLWLVSAGLHLALSPFVSGLHGPIDNTAASLVLFTAISLGVQNAVVHHRAVRLLMRGPAKAGAPAGTVDARSWEEPRD